MRITIVGFGLMGGSIARALAERDERDQRASWQVTAWNRHPEPVERAVHDGIVGRAAASLEDAVSGAELVLLAAPPLACLELLDQLAGPLRPALDDATVTDVTSTKERIVERANRLRLPFVGGHPMAGREVSGYDSSEPELFFGRPWVVVRGSCARLVDGDRVGALVEACGAIAVPLAARVHDDAVAAISHLPLILSVALVEAIVGGPEEPDRTDWPTAGTLAATGWTGMTRLARGDASMAAGIVATNREPLARRLRDLRTVLDDWLVQLEASGDDGSDRDAAARLVERFEAARRRLDSRTDDPA